MPITQQWIVNKQVQYVEGKIKNFLGTKEQKVREQL